MISLTLLAELFDMVISVPVSNDLDMKMVQSRFAEKLKEYTIRIGPSSCDSIYLPTQHDEKRVILRGVSLLQRGLEGLLCTESSLDLCTCGGISSLSNIITNKSLCGLPNLKSLTISNCDCITTLLVGETTLRSTLPNLEHLTLSHLDNLATLLGTKVPRGCLENLKTIKVVGCRLLKNFISFAILRLVPNLEEIRVSDCRMMKLQVIAKDFFETLPKLKTIEVRDMESLRTICSRESGLSALERIVARRCEIHTKVVSKSKNKFQKQFMGFISLFVAVVC
ncbi:disease resistance protein [Pyrus ussuriensis x Pyrus communis]|uniref:Disease resistance protein n=1 Tax=Pyrus ussuriensis x Pyrus communis TaxID=2448454 RepID=A0A5N5GJM1_9ROSA|nr:disease resistance protein [Pyrus ussuriensis x Pyrus communis]